VGAGEAVRDGADMCGEEADGEGEGEGEAAVAGGDMPAAAAGSSGGGGADDGGLAEGKGAAEEVAREG